MVLGMHKNDPDLTFLTSGWPGKAPGMHKSDPDLTFLTSGWPGTQAACTQGAYKLYAPRLSDVLLP